MNKLAKFALLLTAALSSAALAQDPKSTFTVVRSDLWGAQNFNPFLPGSQHLLPTNSAIYESLFFVNSLERQGHPGAGHQVRLEQRQQDPDGHHPPQCQVERRSGL